ncbi:hypothetical protein WMY93_012988 [Mugilogobius chulae]|uniref:Uncharacterized protein n=1 Tax=Mugilogobius chulae TaxID=88201 RepID=A0AAW0P2S8_9GOBI
MLLRDSGYILKRWLMTLVQAPRTPQEEVPLSPQRAARAPEHVCIVFAATVVLHNTCVKKRLPLRDKNTRASNARGRGKRQHCCPDEISGSLPHRCQEDQQSGLGLTACLRLSRDTDGTAHTPTVTRGTHISCRHFTLKDRLTSTAVPSKFVFTKEPPMLKRQVQSRSRLRVNDTENVADDDALKNHVSEQQKVGKEVVCSLMVDEMCIHKQTLYEDQIHGYVDIGTGQVQDVVATQALVVMVVAVNSSWKIPIAYFLINNLNELETSLDVMNMKPFFYHPEDQSQKIHVLLDGCHKLKLMRNVLSSEKVLVRDDGQLIQWKYIEELHKVQRAKGLLLCNKLKMTHIKWRSQKMKVALRPPRDFQIHNEDIVEEAPCYGEHLQDLRDVLDSIPLPVSAHEIETKWTKRQTISGLRRNQEGAGEELCGPIDEGVPSPAHRRLPQSGEKTGGDKQTYQHLICLQDIIDLIWQNTKNSKMLKSRKLFFWEDLKRQGHLSAVVRRQEKQGKKAFFVGAKTHVSFVSPLLAEERVYTAVQKIGLTECACFVSLGSELSGLIVGCGACCDFAPLKSVRESRLRTS